MQLTRTHRILIGVVVAGAVVIAAIGFAGSYTAVRELAVEKGFGNFAYVFPIGIDAGICVLLSLDLLLTWLRIPFPLLRQTAWMLTAATIVFNSLSAWPDPVGVGMHAVIPILFVVAVEAARHAIGRIADITADKHMEGVRITRWLLSPVPTFLLWRRMKLWELRSYEQVIKLEQDRLVYETRLRARYGRNWRRKAPVESLMPLRLARYGVPLTETAPAGLAAAGIEPLLLPPAPDQPQGLAAPAPALAPAAELTPHVSPGPAPTATVPTEAGPAEAGPTNLWFESRDPQQVEYEGEYDPTYRTTEDPAAHGHPQERPVSVPAPRSAEPEPEEPEFPVPTGAGGTRPLGPGAPQPEAPQSEPQQAQQPQAQAQRSPTDEELYQVFRYSIEGEGMPTPGAFAANVEAAYGLRLQSRELNRYMDLFTGRLNGELMEDHIA